MHPDQLQRLRLPLDLLKEPVQLLVADPELAVLDPRRHVRVDLEGKKGRLAKKVYGPVREPSEREGEERGKKEGLI